MIPRRLFSCLILLFATACATTQPVVDQGETKTAIGRADNLHLTVQLSSDHVSPAKMVNLIYAIENLRSVPVAFAELVPDVSYDRSAKTISVSLGTEVPGSETVPRLTRIAPGEKKTFTTGVRIPMLNTVAVDRLSHPRYLQVNAHVLGDAAPFTELVNIPERAVHSPKLADELFPKWIELNETILANAIPIQWNTLTPGATRPPAPPTRRRPRN